MTIRNPALSRSLLLIATAALPLVLLLSSLRTFRELKEQRAVYLRDRVALLAARLERLRADSPSASVQETLSEEEPSLLEAQVLVRGAAGDQPFLASIWNGQELFRTETVRTLSGEVFRAYVPFHSAGGLRIARLDLNPAAADFLMVHARHNVMAALASGVALVLLSCYSLWAMRRAARMQVRQLEMEHLAHIGKMAAVLAHEIRNPLGTIKGFAQLAAERADGSVRDLLNPILSETRRLESLVNDLLAYGRPPAPHPRLVEWREVAAALEPHARQLIGARPIRLVLSGDTLRWHTDPVILQQALLNLVRNAVEAIPDQSPGEIGVKLAAGSRGLAISVTDTGPGIEDSARARLFEPFFTTKAFGTGLGLAITRKLAASLGGELELQTAAKGGAEAILRFPGIEPAAGVPTCQNHGNHSDC